MHRRGFLTRALAAIGGLALGRYADLAPAAMPTAVPASPTTSYVFADQGSLELGIVRLSVLTSSGGFCAPASPPYPLFAECFENAALVRDALPTFVAPRGGVEVPA